MHLWTVATSGLSRAWPTVVPWLAGAVARVPFDLSLDDLHGICAREEGALILIYGADGEAVAAGVTQIREHDGGLLSCWILALGGTGARGWRDTLGTIEAGAARIGCINVQFVNRPGWAGLLPSYDCHVTYEKRLPALEAAATG